MSFAAPSLQLWLGTALAAAGALLWHLRLALALRPSAPTASTRDEPLDVSIIVPARNEAHNLPRLLRSLRALQPAPKEIIVVDDNSEDDTASIAAQAGAIVVSPGPLPAHWNGKPWACRAGANAATATHLLFTDADTEHAPDSLARVLAAQERHNAGLVSVIPTHRIEAFWERLQGVFHLLLLIATGAGAASGKGERRYTIGQYILMPRDVYEGVGGHQAVATRIAEDLALGKLVADRGRDVVTLCAPGLLQVRMYPEGLGGFLRGWRRSFFEGLSSAGLAASIEITLVIAWLLGSLLSLAGALAARDATAIVASGSLVLLAVLSISVYQRRLGALGGWSALCYPVFVLVFIAVSMLAALDKMRGARVVWKGREVISRES